MANFVSNKSLFHFDTTLVLTLNHYLEMLNIRQDPKRLATTLQTENEESCTTYNMLKVSILSSVFVIFYLAQGYTVNNLIQFFRCLGICLGGQKKLVMQTITSVL